MLRTFGIFVGLIVMLGCGIAVAAWPRQKAADQDGFATAQQMKSAYSRVRPGITPVSQLPGLGLDIGRAGKLSYLGVIEHFMPKDSFGFDALDPAVQNCFGARDRCTAYIFKLESSPARLMLLVEGGRVAYKALTGLGGTLASNRKTALRASLD